MVIKNYVPILKSKRGEMAALKYTYDDVLNLMTPLVEILPKYTETKATVYSKLKKSWRGNKILIDVHYCGDIGVKILNGIQQELDKGLCIIPVLQTTTDNNLLREAREIASISGCGLCLRINSDDLKNTNRIEQFLSTKKLDRKNLALLVDLRFIDNEDQYQEQITAINNIYELDSYNTLIISSGCSPESLNDFKVGEDNFIERLDWQYWIKYRNTITRQSTFSDYTTQHPFVLPQGNFPGSKSIRYTIKNRVAVHRGKQSDPSDAYLEHSANLCDYTDYFCGEDYSYGDKYIQDRCDIFNAGGTNNPGNSTSWVAVRVNHHMAFIVKHDLATIPTQ